MWCKVQDSVFLHVAVTISTSRMCVFSVHRHVLAVSTVQHQLALVVCQVLF